MAKMNGWKKVKGRDSWYKENKYVSINKIPDSRKYRVKMIKNWNDGIGSTKRYKRKTDALKEARSFMRRY